MDITWRVLSGEGEGKNGENVQGIRSIIGQHKMDGERLRITINGEAKELICTTHGHELRKGRGRNAGAGEQGRGR